ncbi:DUF4852 domain-containing protein [Gammaproteobacteria bacterium AB-CW1]|uniref:DUF4852 domain-containing protein n=1 Tax=Natronospira elongata TaxID=3110268 RepID=A0AAP6JHN4_9GAMM|nr:DUF4852 domain-containing protein [Gammaproteobacteria bacterium AB-CW1]
MRSLVLATVAFCVLFAGQAFALQPFQYEPAMKHWLSLSDYELQDEDKLARWYIRQHQRQVYNRYRNDEFEFRRRLEAAKTEGLSWLSDVNDSPYVMMVNISFGEYDFEREAFPIETRFGEGYYFYQSGSGVSAPFEKPDGAAHERLDELSSMVIMSFRNYEVMQDLYLPMSPEKAEAFVAERRNSRGTVNRSLRLRLVAEAREADLTDGIRHQFRTLQNVMRLRTDIQEAAIYPADGRLDNPLKEIEI